MTTTWAPPAPPARPRLSRTTARAVTAASAVATGLAVIAAGLWVSLPDDTLVANWALAWAGFDVLVAAAALLTAALLRRGDARAALASIAAAALLVADAWLDVTTSGGSTLALVEAVGVELPLAGAGLWLAMRLTRPDAS